MRRRAHLFIVVTAFATVCCAVVSSAHAACGKMKLRVGGEQADAEPIPLAQFDHSTWHALLRCYVDGNGDVCYKHWQANGRDHWALHHYLLSLGRVKITDDDHAADKKAFFINAYNALTVYGILREYPTVSIQRHNKEDAAYRIFDDLEVWIAGRYMSLNFIEHDVLRPMDDPRIHFALVCAARGCPRLRNEAWCPHCLERQFEDNARDFFADHRRFRINRLTKTVWLSPILKWYGEDFGKTPAEVVCRVFHWLPFEDQQWLSGRNCCRLNIRFLGYDWGLNDRCPTLGVCIGRVPYCCFAKIQPCLAKFQTTTDSPAPIQQPESAGGSQSRQDPGGPVNAPPPIGVTGDFPRPPWTTEPGGTSPGPPPKPE